MAPSALYAQMFGCAIAARHSWLSSPAVTLVYEETLCSLEIPSPHDWLHAFLSEPVKHKKFDTSLVW